MAGDSQALLRGQGESGKNQRREHYLREWTHEPRHPVAKNDGGEVTSVTKYFQYGKYALREHLSYKLRDHPRIVEGGIGPAFQRAVEGAGDAVRDQPVMEAAEFVRTAIQRHHMHRLAGAGGFAHHVNAISRHDDVIGISEIAEIGVVAGAVPELPGHAGQLFLEDRLDGGTGAARRRYHHRTMRSPRQGGQALRQV